MNKWQPLPTQEGWHGVRTIGDTNELNITFERFWQRLSFINEHPYREFVDAVGTSQNNYVECEFIKINTEELMKR